MIMGSACALQADTEFECGFIQEKSVNGKSNEASCSMDPEKVFSTSQYHHKPTDHCDVDEVYGYEDYINFFINDKLARWDWQYGLIESAKPRQKRYYIQQGKSEEEAEKSVNAIHVRHYMFPVFSHFINQDEILINSLTQKPYKNPRKQKIHIYTFGDDSWSFTLYIPEVSGKAILIKYSSEEDSSWVNIRFGTCRDKSHK
jgi:hypothetical protein